MWAFSRVVVLIGPAHCIPLPRGLFCRGGIFGRLFSALQILTA